MSGTAHQPTTRPQANQRKALPAPGSQENANEIVTPDTLTPDKVAAMQRLIGNQSTQRLLRTRSNIQRRTIPNIVQRYTILTPPKEGGVGAKSPYTMKPEEDTNLFSSQRVDFVTSYDTDEESERNEATYTLKSVQFSSKNPPLRVADNGEMAVEHAETKGSEQKVFFATPEIIKQSNNQLDDIGSVARLQAEGGSIVVPANPAAPDGKTVELNRIVPLNHDSQQGTAFKGRTDVCSDFAGDLMGKGSTRQNQDDATAIFQSVGSTKQHTTEMQYRGDSDKASPLQIAQSITTGGDSPEDVISTVEGIDSTPDPAAKTEIEDLFKTITSPMSEMAKTYLIKNYAAQNTPPEAREELKIRVRKLEKLSPSNIDGIMRRYKEAAIVRDYGSMDEGELDTVSQQTGINAYAAPDVGEAFGGISLGAGGMTKVTGDKAEGQIDFRGMSAKALQSIDTLLNPETAAKVKLLHEVMPIAKEAYDYVKTGIWTWHFATVVARSGADAVTLENYNRKTGDKMETAQRHEQLWESLQTRYADLIKADKDLRKDLKTAKDAKAKLEALIESSAGEIGAQLKKFMIVLKAEMPDPNTRWFFQMYGSGAKGQSFHDEWAKDPEGDFVNPMTVRFGEAADATMKNKFKAKLRAMTKDIMDNIENLEPDSQRELMMMFQRGSLKIEAAETKAQVSQAYRETWELLKSAREML